MSSIFYKIFFCILHLCVAFLFLAIFIVFGLLLTAVAMGLGYFNGNSGGAAVPAGIEKRENSETEAFAEDEGRQKPEYETEKFDNVNE